VTKISDIKGKNHLKLEKERPKTVPQAKIKRRKGEIKKLEWN
jgi:hypothetical protein